MVTHLIALADAIWTRPKSHRAERGKSSPVEAINVLQKKRCLSYGIRNDATTSSKKPKITEVMHK